MKHKKTKIAVIFLLLVIGLEAIFLFYPGNSAAKSLEDYASTVIEKCRNEDFKPSCYDREIPKLMDHISMEEAFKVTKFVQEKDSSYAYCHVLGHNLSAREVKKDPGNWKEVLLRCPFGECANGCQHGLLQEVFRGETLTIDQLDKLKTELSDICEAKNGWNPSPFERAHCYHGIGHALLYSNPHEIPRLLNICDEISKKPDGNLSNLCYEGLFMQLFQPLEPEDFALVKGVTPNQDKLFEMCLSYSDEDKQNACFRQGWPLFRDLIMTPQGLVEYCEEPAFDNTRESCFFTLFHVIGQQYDFNLEKIDNFCSGMESELMAGCYYGAASSVMQAESAFITRAVSLCKMAEKHAGNVSDYCYDQIVKDSTYNYNTGSVELANLCRSLPSPWNDECFEKTKI